MNTVKVHASSCTNFTEIFVFQTRVDVFSSTIFSTLLQPFQLLARSFCSFFFFLLLNYTFTLIPHRNYKVCSDSCSIRQVGQWTVNIRKVWIGNLIIVYVMRGVCQHCSWQFFLWETHILGFSCKSTSSYSAGYVRFDDCKRVWMCSPYFTFLNSFFPLLTFGKHRFCQNSDWVCDNNTQYILQKQLLYWVCNEVNIENSGGFDFYKYTFSIYLEKYGPFVSFNCVCLDLLSFINAYRKPV